MSTNNTSDTYKTPPTSTGTTGAFKVGKKLVARKPANENPPPSSSSSSGTSLLFSAKELEALADDSDPEVTVTDVKVSPDPIANATMADVVFSSEFINPLKRINPKKPRNENDYTRLVSIGSITAKALNLDHIKRFATRSGLTGHGRFLKQRMCEAIVEQKINPKKKKDDAKKKKTLPINHFRFINVLFDEDFAPKLGNRGKSLTKDQMTDGIKTDELLFRDFIVLYNNKERFNITF